MGLMDLLLGRISNFGTFALIAYSAGHIKIAHYLCIPYAGSAELTVVAGALVWNLIGIFMVLIPISSNFMGDVGSLGLGRCSPLLHLLVSKIIIGVGRRFCCG